MYNCYNEALAYLKRKYGTKTMGLSSAFEHKIRHLSGKKYREAMAAATAADYNHILQALPDDAPTVDKAIELLLKQFYSGIAVKKELWEFCIALGIIPANADPTA